MYSHTEIFLGFLGLCQNRHDSEQSTVFGLAKTENPRTRELHVSLFSGYPIIGGWLRTILIAQASQSLVDGGEDIRCVVLDLGVGESDDSVSGLLQVPGTDCIVASSFFMDSAIGLDDETGWVSEVRDVSTDDLLELESYALQWMEQGLLSLGRAALQFLCKSLFGTSGESFVDTERIAGFGEFPAAFFGQLPLLSEAAVV